METTNTHTKICIFISLGRLAGLRDGANLWYLWARAPHYA